MTSTTLPQRNGSTDSSPSEPWLRSSVHQFFSTINWEDHPPEVQTIQLTALDDGDAPLSLTLSVHQFFAAINWSGMDRGTHFIAGVGFASSR